MPRSVRPVHTDTEVDRVLTSCFTGAGFVLVLRPGPVPSLPQAVARLWSDSMSTLVLDLQPGHVAGALIRNGRIVSTCLSGEESSKDLAHRAAAHLASVGRVDHPTRFAC